MLPERIDRRTVAAGVAAGVIHAGLALWLGAFVRSSSVVARYTPETPLAAAVLVTTVVGLVLLGGIPVVLLYRVRLVTPLVALLSLFAWAFYGSWQSLEPARTTSVDPGVGFQTDALFGLLWFVPLAVVLLVGAIEYALRSAFGNGVSGAVE